MNNTSRYFKVFVFLLGMIIDLQAMQLVNKINQELVKNVPIAGSSPLFEIKRGPGALRTFSSHHPNDDFQFERIAQSNKVALMKYLSIAGLAAAIYVLTDDTIQKVTSVHELGKYGIGYKEDCAHIILTKKRKDIGKIIFTHHNNEGSIELLWVENNYRNRGLGSILLDEAIKKLEGNGCIQIELMAMPFGNYYEAKGLALSQLVQFYRKFGFELNSNSYKGIAFMKRVSVPSGTP